MQHDADNAASRDQRSLSAARRAALTSCSRAAPLACSSVEGNLHGGSRRTKFEVVEKRSASPVSRGCIAALVACAALFGCSEQRAERAFRRAAEREQTAPLAEVRDELAGVRARWPRTRAAARAEREIEWIDAILSASARGPHLLAWDAVRKVGGAAERFRAAHRRFPDSLDEMVPRYLAGPVLDPWNEPVRYRRTPRGYQVASYGADRVPGGSGADSDLLVENGRRVGIGRW